MSGQAWREDVAAARSRAVRRRGVEAVVSGARKAAHLHDHPNLFIVPGQPTGCDEAAIYLKQIDFVRLLCLFRWRRVCHCRFRGTGRCGSQSACAGDGVLGGYSPWNVSCAGTHRRACARAGAYASNSCSQHDVMNDEDAKGDCCRSGSLGCQPHSMHLHPSLSAVALWQVATQCMSGSHAGPHTDKYTPHQSQREFLGVINIARCGSTFACISIISVVPTVHWLT